VNLLRELMLERGDFYGVYRQERNPREPQKPRAGVLIVLPKQEGGAPYAPSMDFSRS
jgi:hypothetical protein